MVTNPLVVALLVPMQGDARTLVHMPDGAYMSRDAFLALSAQIAHVLTNVGVAPATRVAAQVHKSPHALALYAACLMCGAVFVPFNPAYTAAEMTYMLSDAAPRLTVCDEEFAAHLQRILQDSANIKNDACGVVEHKKNDAVCGTGFEGTKHVTHLMTLNADGGGTLMQSAEVQSREYARVVCDDDSLAAILYTSGTSGRPKGAMLSHRNLLSNAMALQCAWRFSDSDVLLHALPIFHMHGLFTAFNLVLLAGASMIFLPRFDAGEVVRCMSQATVFMGVPTFYTRLLQHRDFTRASVRAMRLFISGSAPLEPTTHAAFAKRCGHVILERYGTTETGMITSNRYDGAREAGAVGTALPGVQVRVVDQQGGAEVACGEVGAIEVSGAGVFRGYWNMEKATCAAFTVDGLFITGDLGTMDVHGVLRIAGRATELIISGGLNVYPREVEIALNALPSICECAVFGVPHPQWGEAVVAVVVADDAHRRETSASNAQQDEAVVLSALHDTLAGFKCPQRIFFTDELPRNAMAKIKKEELRRRYKNLFAEKT